MPKSTHFYNWVIRGRSRKHGIRRGKQKNLQRGKSTRFTTLKVRLLPNAEQAALFDKTFGCCRYIWNRMLSDQERFYLETEKHFIPYPAKYKREAPFLKEVDNQALTQEYNQLSKAFRAFFKNPADFGHPKFKRKKDDRDSFTASNHEFPTSPPTIYTTRDGIRMTKAGLVKAIFPRRPRSGWKLKRITVYKTRTGKYFCTILYECPVKAPTPVLPTEERTLGLKYSMSHFYVTDNGSIADAPRRLQASQEKLSAIQRRLSRMQPGSRNYQQQVQKYRLLHEHIANQRLDFIHKESHRIANEWDAVCVRADALDEMAKAMKRGTVGGAGFGMFREQLRYKLQQRGKVFLTVERYYPSTRTCHDCGHTMEQAISGATWACPACGVVHEREINAAKNIKAQGLRSYYLHQKRRSIA